MSHRTHGEPIVDDYHEPERCLSIGWESSAAGHEIALLFEDPEESVGPPHATRSQANWRMTLDRFEASLAGNPRAWEARREHFPHDARTLPHTELQ